MTLSPATYYVGVSAFSANFTTQHGTALCYLDKTASPAPSGGLASNTTG